MNILTKVVVGSRLHGLENENSDWDYRGVHIHPLKDVLSPFKQIKNTTWIEGDEDNTSYELADFCKQATKGNATILEVFFSNKVTHTTTEAEYMRENWDKFLDTDAFVSASRGYASNQYNKMQLFNPDKRTPKFAVAYIRVMWQCAEFLRTGKFPCQISDEYLRTFLLDVKHNFREELIPMLTHMFITLEKEVTDAYKNANIMKPDIKWIEGFIYDVYRTYS